MGEASDMRLLKRGVACFLVITVFWLASLSTSVAVEYGYVYGIAVDEEGGRLSDVRVLVYTSGGALVANTSTGSDGFFSIVAEFGTYNIYLTKLGYAKAVKSIAIQKSSINLGTIVLRRALRLSTSTLGLVASPGDRISFPFTVSNTGEESEDAELLTSEPEDWSVRVLDQSRQVTKVCISPGQSLTLQLEVTIPLTALVNAYYNVSLTSIGTTNSSLTFTVLVRAQATVCGRILDEYGNGIAEVEIKAYSSDGGLIRSVRASSDGSFTIELPISTISLSFSKEGYVTVTKSISLKGGKVELGEISLSKAIKLFSSVLGLVASPGDRLLIPFTVSNIGGETEIVGLLISGPEGWSTRIISQTGYEVSKVALSSGASMNFQLEVTIPLASAGDNNLTLTAVGRINSSLDFTIKVQKGGGVASIELKAVPPYLDVYAGSQARFKLKLSNLGGYDQLLDLTAEGLPQDLRVWFEDAGKEISKVYVEAGQSKEFYVVVSIPKGARLGAQSFVVSAAGSKTVSLTLNVLGLYKVSITNTNFYTSLNVGGQGTFTLTVRNDGTQVVTNVKAAVMGTVPSGFTVSLEPTSVSSLKVDGEVTFTITIKTESDVNAGNYYIDFNVRSDQTEAQSFTLRVEVVQEMSWIIYGGALIVIAVVGLFLVYRRFGRR